MKLWQATEIEEITELPWLGSTETLILLKLATVATLTGIISLQAVRN